MNRKITAIITAIMTLVVMCGAPAVAFASDSTIEKKETVYVITDSAGQQDQVIVSDRLVNSKKIKTIKDCSDLKDIENIKGDEEFIRKGNNLTWDADGNDIYYQGNTDKTAPVTMDITYRLDGRTISGEKLQGKSGDVEIDIDYTNDSSDGYVPFIVLTGMIITDGSFSDVTVDNGKVIDDGDKQIVVGLAAPGMRDSLDVEESRLSLGDSIKITGTAEKFAVKDMMTIATSSIFNEVDLSDFDELDYDSQINELNKGSKKLVSGTRELTDGLETLQTGIGKLAGTSGGTSGLIPTFKSMKTNVPKLSAAAEIVDTSVQTLNTKLGSDSTENTLIYLSNVLDSGLNRTSMAVSTASSAAENAEGSIKKADEELASISNGVKSVNDKKSELTKTIESNKEALEAVETADGNLYDILKSQADEISTDEISSKAKSAGSELDKAKTQVSDSAKASDTAESSLSAAGSTGLGTVAAYLHNGLKSMKASISGSETIPANQTLLYATGSVNKGLAQMSDTITKATEEKNPDNVIKALESVKSGSSQLSAGSAQISSGMAKLYNEGIKKIVALYNNDLKGLANSLSDMVNAGKDYRTFTKLPTGMDGSVQFVYKTKISE